MLPFRDFRDHKGHKGSRVLKELRVSRELKVLKVSKALKELRVSRAQGTQGFQGTQGTQGFQGTQGTQGTIGAQGLQGVQGRTGPVAGSANQVIYKNGSNQPVGSNTLTFDGTNLSVSGEVNALGGFNLGIHSGGTAITTGIITAVNFIGTGNTVSYNSTSKVVDVSISGGDSWILKEDDYTASVGDQIVADTIGDPSSTSNPFTITLPSNPVFGDTVTIADGNNWSLANLTVTSSDNIEGSSSDRTEGTQHALVKYVYLNSNVGWNRYTQYEALQGAQGLQGLQGLQGIQGLQGSQGNQGTQGTQGLKNSRTR